MMVFHHRAFIFMKFTGRSLCGKDVTSAGSLSFLNIYIVQASKKMLNKNK